MLELANADQIRRRQEPVQAQVIHFYASKKHRYMERQLVKKIELLERIFDPDFTHAIGTHGELMFDAALGRQGFRAEARNTRSWNGKEWQVSNHNLDRIVTRDGIAYGIEIKNTQNYIPRAELAAKLDMCAYLGLKPLFIMRFA